MIQVAGTTTVFAVMMLSGVAAWALVLAPASAMAWYFDRQIFGVVRFASGGATSTLALPGPQARSLGGAGILVVIVAYRRRGRFPVALLSHLCLLLVAKPAYTWLLASHAARTASMVPVEISDPGRALTWLSFLAAALTLGASHVMYIPLFLPRLKKGNA